MRAFPRQLFFSALFSNYDKIRSGFIVEGAIGMNENVEAARKENIFIVELLDLVDDEVMERIYEYYGAAEPPVRCGGSHLSGLTEPPIDSYSA